MQSHEIEHITSTIEQKINKIRETRDVNDSWIIAITDESNLVAGQLPLKAYVKLHLKDKYVKHETEQYHSTIEIKISKNRKIDVCIVNDTIYIGGRYKKNVRGISNTPITYKRENTSRKHKKSNMAQTESGMEQNDTMERIDIRMPAVSDWTIPIQKYFGGASQVFMSSGREDINVRMLGCGRPFLLKVLDPKQNLPKRTSTVCTVVQDDNTEKQEVVDGYNTIEIEYNMNRSVELLQLCVVDGKTSSELLKSIEEDKKKKYAVKVYVKQNVSEIEKMLAQHGWCKSGDVYTMDTIELVQRTPVRVMHRRSNMDRTRNIYECTVEVSEHAMQNSTGTMLSMSLVADAGTYIKEFVNGDVGRTEPSLSQIFGVYCDVVELDVTDINVEYPSSAIMITGIELKYTGEE